MDRINIFMLIGVKPGDMITMRFATERDTATLAHVLAMEQAGVLTVEDYDLHFLAAVYLTNDWKGTHDQEWTFMAGPRWDRHFFAMRMDGGIEALAITPTR